LQRQKLRQTPRFATGRREAVFAWCQFAFGKPADAAKLPVVVPGGFRYLAALIQRQWMTAGNWTRLRSKFSHTEPTASVSTD
jgi:hypothetical protein